MDLTVYDVVVGGHKTRMQLSDADAEAMGLKVNQPTLPFPGPDTDPDTELDNVDAKSRPVVANKMRGPR